MNAVDINNQLTAPMTPIRGRETRNWRPLWLWLLDVCTVNAYLIWLQDDVDSNHRGQARFRDELALALMTTDRPPPIRVPTVVNLAAQPSTQGHQRTRWKTSGYCVHCKTDPKWKAGHASKRIFGTVLDPNSVAIARRKRGSLVKGGCAECKVYLCVMGPCFDQWHSSL
jgi:hypothetical protein